MSGRRSKAIRRTARRVVSQGAEAIWEKGWREVLELPFRRRLRLAMKIAFRSGLNGKQAREVPTHPKAH